jgi:transposase
MSLKPMPIPPVPAETAQVARAAFPKGTLCMKLREKVGTIVQDTDFIALFSKEGAPGLPPWRLALVTILQFHEQLSDRQAAEAVRARIDWKYLLSLELTDPGFDFSVLSEFRARLVKGGAAELLLEKLLACCRALGLVKAWGKQRTDSTHVVAAVRCMNRLELVGETLRAALNDLAVQDPEWVRAIAPAAWYERYQRRSEQGRLPKGKAAREQYARTVGEDGFYLLEQLAAPTTPAPLRERVSVQTLTVVWAQQYERLRPEATSPGDAASHRTVRWKELKELPRAAAQLESPYDLDARYRTKPATHWLGYQVHYTETCDRHKPSLITHVHTTPATVHDSQCTALIQDALEKRQLLPREHLVDAGYIDAELLVHSAQDHHITLVGPTRPKAGWQNKVPGAYSHEHFVVDWDRTQVRCPHGKWSLPWHERRDPSRDPWFAAHFRTEDCAACPTRHLCTRSSHQARFLKLLPRAQQEALQTARATQATEAGQKRYAQRAGIEGTISQSVRAFGARRSRYRGLPKTHLQQVLTAVAINVRRLIAWFEKKPKASTRTSHFAALAA